MRGWERTTGVRTRARLRRSVPRLGKEEKERMAREGGVTFLSEAKGHKSPAEEF